MKRTGKHDAQREDGFTLAEMLIALFVLAMIASLSSAAILFAANASTRAGTSTDVKRAQAVQNTLKPLLETARPEFATIEGEQRGVAFVGQSDRLVFVAQTPAPTELPGLYVLELSLSSDQALGVMMLRYWPFAPERAFLEPGDGARERVLLENVDLEISYGVFDADTGWLWEDAWVSEDERMPDIISLKITGVENQNLDHQWLANMKLRRNR